MPRASGSGSGRYLADLYTCAVCGAEARRFRTDVTICDDCNTTRRSFLYGKGDTSRAGLLKSLARAERRASVLRWILKEAP